MWTEKRRAFEGTPSVQTGSPDGQGSDCHLGVCPKKSSYQGHRSLIYTAAVLGTDCGTVHEAHLALSSLAGLPECCSSVVWNSTKIKIIIRREGGT